VHLGERRGVEPTPHRRQTPVESRLDRPDGPADALCDTFQGQVGPVVEQDHDPLVVIECGHRPENLVAIEDRPERIPLGAGESGIIDRDHSNLAATAEAITADVDEDSVEPRLESGRVAQRSGRPPGPQQGILRRILRLMLIAEDQPSPAVGAVKLAVGKAKESFRGTGPTSLASETSSDRTIRALAVASIVLIQTIAVTKPFSQKSATTWSVSLRGCRLSGRGRATARVSISACHHRS
jgi:hypothetical protein